MHCTSVLYAMPQYIVYAIVNIQTCVPSVCLSSLYNTRYGQLWWLILNENISTLWTYLSLRFFHFFVPSQHAVFHLETSFFSTYVSQSLQLQEKSLKCTHLQTSLVSFIHNNFFFFTVHDFSCYPLINFCTKSDIFHFHPLFHSFTSFPKWAMCLRYVSEFPLYPPPSNHKQSSAVSYDDDDL